MAGPAAGVSRHQPEQAERDAEPEDGGGAGTGPPSHRRQRRGDEQLLAGSAGKAGPVLSRPVRAASRHHPGLHAVGGGVGAAAGHPGLRSHHPGPVRSDEPGGVRRGGAAGGGAAGAVERRGGRDARRAGGAGGAAPPEPDRPGAVCGGGPTGSHHVHAGRGHPGLPDDGGGAASRGKL